MKYEILKNDRYGPGFRDSRLRCTRCDGISTRYIKIKNKDELMDYIHPTILCSTCLHNFIEELNASILEGV